MFKRKELNKNWNFALATPYSIEGIPNQIIKPGEWYPATVPGTIHTDLLNNNLIEDPFYSDNELKLNWIANCDWIFQTEFDFKDDSKNNINLVFEGLDTICEIYLNDVKLGNADNMFLSYRYGVKKILKPSGNLLKLIFKSPVKYASEQEEKYGKLPVALNSGRVYIRKAQYSFGWDWGPSFPTSGIWRNVYIEEYSGSRIMNVTFHTTKLDEHLAEIDVFTEITSDQSNNLSLQISLLDEHNIHEQEIDIVEATKYKSTFEIKNPKLWWPNGEGGQSLYTLIVKIIDGNKIVLDEVTKSVGIRKLELIINEEGKSTFKFRINNRDIYCQGINWIPADSFLPRITKEKYSELLLFAKQANMNIVRVWGGGIYEEDEFYSLCDQFGFLVWQDFMFACGSYPEHELFIDNVKKEIPQNILRLQHHPSLAIWCGNNENEWIWYQEQKTSYKKMPGYKIYHEVIPEILNELDPLRPYWPSSPFGNEEDPNSFDSGNNHQWDLWSRWIDYTHVVNDKSHFVTEFGFQGPANKSTFEKYLPGENRKIQDKVFEFHNKQVEGPERLIKFLAGHLPLNTGWSDFIYLAQLSQAFALKTCLEYWKYQSAKTNGSIIWQLNDCWPVTSWSIIDSELSPKISYYFVRNIFKQKIIGIKKEAEHLVIVGLNQTSVECGFNLKLQAYKDKTGELIFEDKAKYLLPPWSKKEIHKISTKNLPDDNNWVIIISLINDDEEVIFRNFYSETKWKYKMLSASSVDVEVENEESIFVKADKLTLFVDLIHPEAVFSDRGFILLPGEIKKLKLLNRLNKSLVKEEIQIFTLNNYLQR